MKKGLVFGIILFFGVFALPVEAAKEVSETDYRLTLEEAVSIQVNAEAPPISSAYADDPAYVSLEDVAFMRPLIFRHMITYLRAEPSLESPVAHGLFTGVPYVTGVVQGAGGLGDDVWFEVLHDGGRFYVLLEDVFVSRVRVNRDVPALAGRNVYGHVFGGFSLGDVVALQGVYPDFVGVDFGRWRTAKPAEVAAFMDVSAEAGDDFEHLRLDALAGASADELDVVLEGRGSLAGEGAAFVRGASEYGINEAYLMAHAFLETGNGTSELASGVEVGLLDDAAVLVSEANRADVSDVELVYNMFGIGAADSCPLECGAIAAYEQAWTSPAKAIEGGAGWIGSGYIYNEYEQNTLYKMKWNPRMFEGHAWKQYATDVAWAQKQTELIGAIYAQLEAPDFHFDYPKFKN